MSHGGSHIGPRMRVEIDRGLLLDALRCRGLTLKKASAEMGYVDTYLHTCCYQGEIGPQAIEKLKKQYKVQPEEYVSSACPKKVVKKRMKPAGSDPWKTEKKRPNRCRTCIYRGDGTNGIGCEYILITGKRRGCPAESCDKYIKGPRKKEKAVQLELTGAKARRRKNEPSRAKTPGESPGEDLYFDQV